MHEPTGPTMDCAQQSLSKPNNIDPNKRCQEHVNATVLTESDSRAAHVCNSQCAMHAQFNESNYIIGYVQ
jgi:hypothetical protein